MFVNCSADIYDVQIQAIDDLGRTAVQSYTLEVANAAPVFAGAPSELTVPREGALTHDFQTDDEGVGDGVTYSLNNAPTWATIGPADGLLSVAVPDGIVGDYPVTVLAGDTHGGLSEQTLTLHVDTSGPSFISDPITTAVEDVPYAYTAEAEGHSVTYVLLAGPPELTIDPDTGEIGGLFVNCSADIYDVQVQATDDLGRTAVQSYTLEVANAAPVFAGAPSELTVPREGALTHDFQTDDEGVGDGVTYSLDAAPTWATIGLADGLLSVAVPDGIVGDYPVTILAGDTHGGLGEHPLTLHVDTSGPSFISDPITTAVEDIPYAYPAEAEGHSVTYILLAGPPELTIDPDTGEIGGLFVNCSAGIYDVQVQATDDLGRTAVQSYTLEVANAAPVFLGPPLALTVPQEGLLACDFQTDDEGVGDGVTYTLGDAPAWITIASSSGLLSVAAPPGVQTDFQLTILAADTQGGSSEHPFVLHVDTGIILSSAPEGVHTVLMGDEFLWDVDSDLEGQAGSVYTLPLAPDWLEIDSDTGLMRGTPTRWWHVANGQIATVRMDVASGDYTEHTFSINVLGHVVIVEAARKMRSVSFRDADNDLVKVNLAGRVGRAVLVRAIEPGVNGYSLAQPGDLFGIEFDESDDRTGLSVKVKRNKKAGGDGQTTLNRVFGGSAVRGLAAGETQLVGAGIEMTGEGHIKTLKLLDILDGADVIMSGAGATKGVVIKTGRIGHGTDIALNSGIKTLESVEYLGGSVVAPWADRVITKGRKARKGRPAIRGDFGADLTLTEMGMVVGKKRLALRQLKVAGYLHGATIHSAGSIGVATVGAMIDSSAYVGLLASFGSGLPSQEADFFSMPDEQMPTLRLKVNGVKGLEHTFVNSNICVWNLRDVVVELGHIQTDNDGAEFGIVGQRMDSYQCRSDKDIVASGGEASGETEIHRAGDFVVRLV